MTFGGFILGLMMMGVGLVLTWRTSWFVENFGDLGALIGWRGSLWLSWKLLGIFLMLLGFLVAFELLGLFFSVTIGGLFQVGGLER